ncbi:MAG: cyclic nucleotide-binding domain-containing protein [Chlamydiae bacterium]|nr:cyclic nucleotide-binding domain-containing protein [Chlamydiota bacterium]MBI3276177.1 cyclic nucleotide-binding domain-containing protein [Chlamydiota bacterium]
MSIDVFSFLKRSDLCRGFSDHEISELKGCAQLLEVSQGHVLFKKGDLADALYLIGQGAIEIRLPAGAHEETIARLGENAVLGEVGILTDQIRSATAVAVLKTTLLKMNRGALERFLSEGRLGAFKLMYQIAKILSFRLRQMDEAFANMLGQTQRPHELNQLRARLQADWPF